MKHSDAPVTVVIPVRDGAHLIEPALESVARQTMRPRQVVVVESASSAVSARETCERFDFVTYVESSATPAGTLRNIGAARAEEEILAFLDCDDIWPERRTEVLMSVISSDPGVEYVAGQVVQVRLDEIGKVVVLTEPAPNRLPTCALMRTALFGRIGGFRDEWKVGETIEWWSRASDSGVVSAMVDDVVLMRRLHETNTGRTVVDVNGHYLHMLHDVISRRRGVPSEPGARPEP